MGQDMRADRVFRRRRFWYRFFRAITLFTLLAVALGIGLVAGLFASVSDALPSGEELANIRPPTPTRVLASDGTVLAKFYSENREIVPINRMAHMIDATLAIEDIRFMAHPGIDLHGIARAMVKNLISRDSREGASTITQQLARNLYLSREKKLARKLQEMILALELERRYSKQEILETYLNQVFYGSNKHGLQCYGVQAAAKSFFNKDVSKLTIAEAALLAGLPKNPRDYNPYRYPDAARDRRNLVLANMRDYGFISRQQYRDTSREPLKLAPEKKPSELADARAPYFVRHVISAELQKIYGEDANDYIYRYGIDIHTSLDPRMQKVAEDAVKDGVERNHYRRIQDGALISIDPKTGFIKAMVGGINYRADQFNIVTQGLRQPGSAFKPFVYTTALMHGYTPTTRVFDRPGHYPSGTGRFWSPKNSDGRYRGAMQLQQALWGSRNAAAVSVANDLGIPLIIDTAHEMGIKHRLENYLTTALGASVVFPIEICSAYGTLANGGVLNPPAAIESITSDNSVLYKYSPTPRRSIPTIIADTMQKVMRGVIERGTARAIAPLPFIASGKTGTTNSFHDAWFIGYTDDLVTAVWVGNRHNEEMNHTFGATVPAPIWKRYMLVAQPIMAAEHQKIISQLTAANNLPELTNVDMTPSAYIAHHGNDTMRSNDRLDEADAVLTPPNPRDRMVVMICQQTHQRATSWCPDVRAVTFYRGRPPYPPSRLCTVHAGPTTVPQAGRNGRGNGGETSSGDTDRGVVISVCAETGKIATSRCPTVLRRRFRADNAPTETCPLHRD